MIGNYMDKEDRINEIKRIIVQCRKVNVDLLSKSLAVSAPTIRNDLSRLEAEGFLARHHGGAEINDFFDIESDFADHCGFSKQQKCMIADTAAKMIETGDFVFLGAGYTCYQIAKRIKNKQVCIVTNNLYAVLELYRNDQIHLIVTGGKVCSDNGSVYMSGEFSMDVLDQVSLTKSFISPVGVSMQKGYCVLDEEQQNIYQKIIRATDELFILVNSDKFDKTSMISFLPINASVKVITNHNVPLMYKQYFNKKKMAVFC